MKVFFDLIVCLKFKNSTKLEIFFKLKLAEIKNSCFKKRSPIFLSIYNVVKY